MSQKPDPMPSDTNSANAATPEVRYALPRELDESFAESLKAKCTDCDALTQHAWVKITPCPLFEVKDPMEEVISKAKRILMCMTCSKFSLKS